MKKGILWMLLSFLLVAALVLASCAPTVPGEQEEEEEEEEEKVGPQYGGTYTMHLGWAKTTVVWDEGSAGGVAAATWSAPYATFLLRGGLEEYGPRGTNEFQFNAFEYIPEQFLVGCVAESWEWSDPLTLVFTIRPGVMWTGNEHIGMEPREFTAYDAEFGLNRNWTNWIAAGWDYMPYISSIYATDRYTLVVEFKEFNASWPGNLTYWLMPMIYPPEVVEAGASDWRNQSGTGPFILTDYVEGSQATYERNPNYWRKTTINGKEYQIPFIDKWVIAIIPDLSTEVAAVRTAKLDLHIAIPLVYEDTLLGTPGLILERYLHSQTHAFMLKNDHEYLGDRNVRRALMMGIDFEAIRDTIFPAGEIHNWPISSLNAAVYTPIEDLPASAQELYDYNPEKAKQMLADAGYPDGFDLHIYAAPQFPWPDLLSLVISQWDKIGVELDVTMIEYAAYSARSAAADFEDMLMRRIGHVSPTASPLSTLGVSTSGMNAAGYKNERFDELYLLGERTLEPRERDVLWKEAALIMLEDVAYIPFPNPVRLLAYWPWLKNYYGELDNGDYNFTDLAATLWIDQDLKAEMGY